MSGPSGFLDSFPVEIFSYLSTEISTPSINRRILGINISNREIAIVSKGIKWPYQRPVKLFSGK